MEEQDKNTREDTIEEEDYQIMRRQEVEKMIEGSHLLQEKYFDEDTRGAMSEWVKQQWMIKECVEERISVATVIDRWKWGFGKEEEEALVKMVEEEGLELPEQNVAAIYPGHSSYLSHPPQPTVVYFF